MDKDKAADTAEQVRGSFKEAIGKVTGDAKTQAEGTAEKVSGEAGATADRAKDAERKTTGE